MLHSRSMGDRVKGQLPVAALLLVACSVCLAWTDLAQRQYVFDTWGLAAGLPQVSVLDIEQDAEGYLWLATQSGLARFDGVEFTVFDRTNTAALPTNSIESLFIDSRQRLWVGTAHGIAVVDEGRWHSVDVGGIDYGAIGAIVETDEQLLLLATSVGILFVDDELKLKRFGGERTAYSILHAANEVIIGGEGVVNVVADASHEYWDLPEPLQRAEHLLLHDQALWIGTNSGLLKRTASGQFERPLLGTPWEAVAVESLLAGPDGSLWVGTYSALLHIQRDGSIRGLDESVFGFLPWVVSLKVDREGNVWAGSQTHGLIRIWPGWTSRIALGEAPEDAFVWSILPMARQQGVWVGTNNGLWQVTDRVEKVLSKEQLTDPAVYTLTEDGDGLWLGTRAGLAYWRDGTLQYRWEDPLRSRQINAVYRQGPDVWVATDAGLFVSDNLGPLRAIGSQSGLDVRRIRVLHGGADGQLLVGSERGLFKRQSDGQFERMGPESLHSAFVTALLTDNQGGLIVGTYDAGLFYVADGTWRQINRRRGLPTDSSFALDIVQDYLWVGSSEGVYRMKLEGLQQTDGRVDAEMLVSAQPAFDGAQYGRCCNGAGLARSLVAAGALWYPTLDGVMGLYPSRIERNEVPPTVVIESLLTRSSTVPVDQPDLGSIGSRDVEIKFTATSYQNPADVKFRYRLLGYDQTWVDADTRRRAFYTNLAAGDYQFEVEAFNNSGVASQSPAMVKFSVQQRFYETHWFTLLLGLAIALTVYLLHRLRLHSLNERQRLLEAKVAERTDELAAANRRLLSANRALREASERDELTGLHNRRFMSHQLRDFEDARSPEQSEDLHSVLMLVDIDFFKRINDTYGHARGDEVLQQFSALLLDLTRDTDHVLRWGGEEFLMILEHSGSEQAGGVAERIRQRVAEHRFVLADQTVVKLTCSIGFSIFPVLDRWPEAVSWRACLELADRALYAVKASGRDGWASLDPTEQARPEHFHSGFTHRLDELFAQDVIRWLASHEQMRLPDRQVSAR